LSPDGSRLAYTSILPNTDIPQVWLANPDGTLPTQIREGHSPAWSPDNARIAYVVKDGLSGNDCVWVMGADGGNPTRLTNPDTISRHPAWTPDGKIVFSCNRGLNDQQKRNFDIWMMNGDGSNPTQLTVNGSYDVRPAVSADNKYLYFISNRGAQKERDDSLQIWRITF
jgi:TolB protein